MGKGEREHVTDSLKMKIGKASILETIVMELLKYGADDIIECLLRIVSRCMEVGAVPEDWKIECIVSVYKVKKR